MRARTANAELVKNHGYTKYTVHIDVFELTLCNYYLTNEEYGRLSRKYQVSTMPVQWQILMRFLYVSRLDTLDDNEAKERHIRRLRELIEDGKHSKVAYGTQFKTRLIEKLI